MAFHNNWEKKIYSLNKHINKYPYGELVSVFFNSLQYKNTQSVENINILELGCGAGNNIKFFSEQGYNTFGIDGSLSACQITQNMLEKHNLNGTIKNATFDNLPFENALFDIIVDREAMYCGTLNDIKNHWKEANRTLKTGGIVISFMYTDSHNWLQKAKSKPIATQVEENTYTDFIEGDFFNTGIAHFTKYEEIFEIFNFLEIKSINKHTNNTIYTDGNIHSDYEEWIIVGVKK